MLNSNGYVHVANECSHEINPLLIHEPLPAEQELSPPVYVTEERKEEGVADSQSQYNTH